MVTWFTGTREGTEDQIGVTSTMKPGTAEWSEPEAMIRMFEYEGDHWVTEQVVPIETESGETIVYTWASPRSTFRLVGEGEHAAWLRVIEDNRPFRFRWSDGKAQDLECLSGQAGLEELGIVFQGKPKLRHPDQGPTGGWIMPYHTQREPVYFRSRFLFIGGDGLALESSEADLYQPPGALEPALARFSDDRWLCYMRYGKRGEGFVWRSESNDGCRTFTEPVATNLRNPHAAVDIAVGRNGRLGIVYNDSHSLRTPLTLGISEDEGRTFRAQDVETVQGEFSYPKLHQTRDGQWHLFYTHYRTGIAHVRFDEDWLMAGRKVVGLRTMTDE
jgi:hypothetical protein